MSENEVAKQKGSKDSEILIQSKIWFKQDMLSELAQLLVGVLVLLAYYFLNLNSTACLVLFVLSIASTWHPDIVVTHPVCLGLVGLAILKNSWPWQIAIVLACCTFLTINSIAFAIALERRKKQVNAPGENYPFFSGVLAQMIPNLQANTFYNWRLSQIEKFEGKTFKDAPPCFVRDVVLNLVTPEDVEYILKTNVNNYVKSAFFRNSFQDILGSGIFNANHAFTADGGDSWHTQRKIASKIFTGNNFRGHFMQCFVDHGVIFQDILEQQCIADEKSNNKANIDIQELFFRYTLDCIGQLGFGVDLGCLKDKPLPFAKAFDRAQAITFMKFYVSTWEWPIMNLWIPEKRELSKHISVLDEFAYKVIEQRKGDKQLHEKNDLLSLVLREPKEEFSPKFLRDLILNIALAGRDTTACTLTWIFYLLSQHPNEQATLLEEIDEKLRGEAPTYDHLNNPNEMPYLHGVVSEALRLYPAVPVDPKVCVEADVLPSGVVVPPGTFLQYHPFLMGRSPSLWSEPEVFKPERWLNQKHPGFFVFPVFQAGPRICLGMNMAQLEAKVLTCMVLQKFTLSLEPGFEPIMNVGVTLSSKNGLKMQVTRRTI